MIDLRPEDLLFPDWKVPSHVKACITTRRGGVSKAPYDSLNLGDHVGDAPQKVHLNRERLQRVLSLPGSPYWLNQVHSKHVVPAGKGMDHQPPEADASYTREQGVVCVVMTADCLPVLFCDRQGQVVAAAHAGWRGLANGILEATVESMAVPEKEIIAWLGPAIGPTAFEVGAEVHEQFMEYDIQADAAFSQTGEKYLANLEMLAKQRLGKIGLENIYGGGYCTYRQEALFFSYRRDHHTGRMASLIWLDNS